MKKNVVKKVVASLMLVVGISSLTACSNKELENNQQQLADLLIQTYNSESNYYFSNAKFRNITKENNEIKKTYNIYLIAQMEENPYFIKTKIDTEEDLTYIDALRMFSKNIDSYPLEFYCTKTNMRIIETINSLSTEENVLTSPSQNYFNNAIINGYFVNNGEITFETTVSSIKTETYLSYYTPDANNPTNRIPITKTKTYTYYDNKYTSVTKENGKKEESFVLECLNDLQTISSESFYVKNNLALIENLIYCL